MDGISLFLIVLTGILFPIALLAVDPGHDDRAYFAWMLLLEAGVIGVFCAMDLMVFFLCFEVVIVPMYFLIGRWGHGNSAYAATKFFLFTMAGSALMLIGDQNGARAELARAVELDPGQLESSSKIGRASCRERV